jgi:hypothetical protein
MKKSLKIIFFTLLWSFQLHASGNQNNEQSRIDREVANIDAQLMGFRKVTKTIFDESSEGGEIAGYCDGLEIRKITAEFLGEMGGFRVNFYFRNDFH